MLIVRVNKKYGIAAMPHREGKRSGRVKESLFSSCGGSVIVEPEWERIEANICLDPDKEEEPFEMDSVTCNYYVKRKGLWGILDENGHMILEPQYETVDIVQKSYETGIIRYEAEHGFPGFARAAACGRVIVSRRGKWGMLCGQGREILPTEYDSIKVVPYHWPISNVYIVRKDGVSGAVDENGKIVIPMKYPSLECDYLDYVWSETIFTVRDGDKTGYVRLGSGEMTVEPKWDQVELYRLYLAPDDEPGGAIYIVWRNGRCGLVYDTKGLIIPAEWDEIIPWRVELRDPMSYSVRKGNQWGCCDKTGQLISDAKWDEMGAYYEDIACVKKDGRWGAIGPDGQLCIPTEWDEIDGFGIRRANVPDRVTWNRAERKPDCLSWAKKNGLWGLIDRNGHVVAAPAWETYEDLAVRKKQDAWVVLTDDELQAAKSAGDTSYKIVWGDYEDDDDLDAGELDELLERLDVSDLE